MQRPNVADLADEPDPFFGGFGTDGTIPKLGGSYGSPSKRHLRVCAIAINPDSTSAEAHVEVSSLWQLICQQVRSVQGVLRHILKMMAFLAK